MTALLIGLGAGVIGGVVARLLHLPTEKLYGFEDYP